MDGAQVGLIGLHFVPTLNAKYAFRMGTQILV
jgi:hypothetical protein